MSIFDSLENGNQQQGRKITPQQALSQLQGDPSGTLRQCGLNIPSGMNNPQQIVQHLMQSGQLSQGIVGQATQLMNRMIGGR